MSDVRRFCWLVLAVLPILSGCEAPPAQVALTAHEIESPAGVDSGEPFLSASGGTVLMSWLGRSPDGVRQLLFSRYVNGAWEEPRAIAERESLLVNVADFPSITAPPDGSLWAHWLEREPGGGYGIRVTRSSDGGATWQEPWTPHEDGTPTDHGFVSTVPVNGGIGLLWLDGRAFAASADGSAPSMETALFFRSADASGPVGPETLLDPRVCDCCQTDVAITSEGPVAVYRDRSPDEIRDIRATRYVDGSWTEGRLVHADGWETGACPINGPAVAARDRRVAVAWFTAAGGEFRVLVAFSDDAGRTFGDPIQVDDGSPAGRVDVVLLADGTGVVSWVERTGGGAAGVRVRRVGAGGRRLETVHATSRFSERAIGFPRLARAGDGAIILAWTDGTELTPRVRVTRIEVEES